MSDATPPLDCQWGVNLSIPGDRDKCLRDPDTVLALSIGAADLEVRLCAHHKTVIRQEMSTKWRWK